MDLRSINTTNGDRWIRRARRFFRPPSGKWWRMAFDFTSAPSPC